MKSYTITIAPDDAAGATAVIQVVVNDSGPLLKRFSLIASEGQILSTAELSRFDSERLVSAVLPAATLMPAGNRVSEQKPVAAKATVARPGARQVAMVERPGPAVVTPPQPATVLAAPKRTRVNAARRKSDTALTSLKPTKSQATGPRESNSAKPDKLKAARAANRAQRNYRVMPTDFLSRYGTSTMAELAAAYGVPLYTIQSWIGTARKQGKLPPARKRRSQLQ
jgi:hypothetical protein